MKTVEELESWLKATERKYGGPTKRLPCNVPSPYDTRAMAERSKNSFVGGDRMGYHGFAGRYAEHLLPFIGKKVTLVEIGVLLGTGLAIWCDLFPDSRIIGLDIDPNYFSIGKRNLRMLGAFEKNEPEIYRFDQLETPKLNTNYLLTILSGDKISISVDDGMHTDQSVMNTYAVIKPLLASPGLHFIEDNRTAAPALAEKYPDHEIIITGPLAICKN